MSEIARELKMLFYLDSKYKHGNPYIKISELADYLEISERQVRRYRDDLEQAEFYIENKFGPEGGYRLVDPIDKTLFNPDNIMLALTLSSRTNDSILQSLKKLPVAPCYKKRVEGDTFISEHDMDVLSIIAEAIHRNRRIHFEYDIYNKPTPIDVEPYKVFYTHHTYYLRGVSIYKDDLRKYDISKMSNVTITDTFTPDDEIIRVTDEELLIYGIFDETKDTITIRLKYHDQRDANMIDRFFEYKGSIDSDNMIYTVVAKNNAEPFYPIFALHDKVEIMDEAIKKHYINYMKKYIEALEG